jgi:hypothetical protein
MFENFRSVVFILTPWNSVLEKLHGMEGHKIIFTKTKSVPVLWCMSPVDIAHSIIKFLNVEDRRKDYLIN